MKRPHLLMVATLASVAVAGHALAAGVEIYVSVEDGGDVVVVDVDRAEVTARIPVGKRPRGVKLSRDGKLLYVALSGSPKGGPGVDESKLPPPDRAADGVGVVDLATRKLLRVLQTGQDPESFDLSLDGHTLYVSNEETAEMTVVDLVGGAVKRRVPVGKEPEGVALRPDGKVVYVTSEEESVVVAIDTVTLSELRRIPTGPRPRSIVFTQNGRSAFVTDEFGAEVTVIDAVKHKPAGSIKIVAKAKTVLGPRPMGAVLSPDGKQLFVSNGRGESVAVIDVAKRKLVRMIDGVGARPWGIGVSPDGKRIFTANGPSDDVSIIDVATGTVEKRVKVGGLPWGLVVSASAQPKAKAEGAREGDGKVKP
jgi:YVTN family beta-propeller protein